MVGAGTYEADGGSTAVMRTPEQCLAKAADLEHEAKVSKSDTRRQAFLELADQWRRLAAAQARNQRVEPVAETGRWRLRRSPLN